MELSENFVKKLCELENYEKKYKNYFDSCDCSIRAHVTTAESIPSIVNENSKIVKRIIKDTLYVPEIEELIKEYVIYRVNNRNAKSSLGTFSY